MEINSEEPVGVGVKRVCTELVRSSHEALTHRKDLDNDIHSTRKNFKKLRGILRAIRPALGDLVYRRENAFYRDLGRELADYRESFVQIKTLDVMGEAFPDELENPSTATLRQQLKDAHAERLAGLEGVGVLETVVARLQRAEREIADWPVGDDAVEELLAGIARTYRRGRREFDACLDAPTSEALHSWRKRVKYLWYQLMLVRQAWPELLGPLAEAVHALADDLGDDHDYADFEARVIDGGEVDLGGKTRKRLHKAMVARREALQASAFAAARRIYAEPPRAFARRLGCYLHLTWR